MSSAGSAQQQKVYGSVAPYHQADYDKMLKMEYEVKSLDGYSQEFKTSSIEMKTATLPEYNGNMKSVPLTEWKSPKSDFYTKSLTLRDFEIKKAVETWSKPATLNTETAFPVSRSKFDGRESEDSSKAVEKSDLPPPYAIKNEELQNLINHGSEAPTVKLGRGFNTKAIKGTSKSAPKQESRDPR